jgi:hypothetical protein
MYHSDILVTSKSGFSQVPAELGNMIVIASPFWHEYSDTKRIIMTDGVHGSFSAIALAEALGCMQDNGSS